MFDTIKLRCDRLHLAPSAVKPKMVPDGFSRSHHQGAANRSGRLTLTCHYENAELFRASALKLEDGRWQASRFRANLPKLLYGHNGRVLKNEHEVALGFARIRWILRQIIQEADWGRIIPGVGPDNSGYLDYLESTFQINDPDRTLIRASHFARLPYQRFPSCVYYGESTRASLREIRVSIYDKLAESKLGFAEPADSSPTRVEVIFRNGDRLANEMKHVANVRLADNCKLATLSLDDAFRVHQRVLRSMAGFRWALDPNSVSGLSKTARLLLLGIGDALGDPFRVDEVLDFYNRSERPTERNFRSIAREVRDFAGRAVASDARAQLPDDRLELHTADVVRPDLEDRFARHMESLGAPSEPDADILSAWSATRFVSPPVRPGGLFGLTAPRPLPFLGDTL